MSQTETLKPQQLQAIDHLLLGDTVTGAAEAAAVGRSTLHRWLKDDLKFQAELNRQRNQLRDQLEDRLHALATEAVGIVEKAVQEGDPKTALALLKGVGLLDGIWKRQPEDAMALTLLNPPWGAEA